MYMWRRDRIWKKVSNYREAFITKEEKTIKAADTYTVQITEIKID